MFLRVTLLKVIVLFRFFRKIMKYLKTSYRLLVYFTSFTVCSEILKTGHFQSFFSLAPTLNLIFFPT